MGFQLQAVQLLAVQDPMSHSITLEKHSVLFEGEAYGPQNSSENNF
jgi:hypothetical protein